MLTRLIPLALVLTAVSCTRPLDVDTPLEGADTARVSDDGDTADADTADTDAADIDDVTPDTTMPDVTDDDTGEDTSDAHPSDTTADAQDAEDDVHDADTAPTFTLGPVHGRVGGWVRRHDGEQVVSGFLCGAEGNDSPELRASLVTDDEAGEEVVASRWTLSADAPWLDEVRPFVSTDCATHLVAFEVVLDSTPAGTGGVRVDVRTDEGWMSLDPTGAAPQWPRRPLEGALLLNHDGFAHYLVTDGDEAPLSSPWRPTSAQPALGLSPAEVEALFAEEFAVGFDAGVDGIPISLVYGQNAMWQSDTLPFEAHRTYWTAREPACDGPGATCFSDNLLALLAAGTSLRQVYLSQQRESSLRIASVRLNDNHHVLPGDGALYEDGRGPTRLIAGTPPFVERYLDGTSVPTCVVPLDNAEVRATKLALVEELLSAEPALDALELDLTRRFCGVSAGSDLLDAFMADVAASRDALSPTTRLLVRLPRDADEAAFAALGMTAEGIRSWEIDGMILGRATSARSDGSGDATFLWGLARTLEIALFFDIYQLDRRVTHTEDDLSDAQLELPMTFHRMMTEQSSALARGASGVSLFNFQYYPLRYTTPTDAGWARVLPPYAWLSCLEQPACVDTVDHHYAGGLASSDSWLLDYRAPAQGTEGVTMIIHPDHAAVANATALRAWLTMPLRVTNLRTLDEVVVATDARPYTDPLDTRLALAAPYDDYLTGDPTARTVTLPPPEGGLQRYRFDCDGSCELIGDVEVVARAAAYPF